MLTTFPYCNFSVRFPQLFIENLIIFGGVQYAWQFRNKAFLECIVLQSLSCLFVTTPWPLTFIIIGRWRNISAGKSNSMTSTKKSQADIINWGSEDIKDLKYLERHLHKVKWHMWLTLVEHKANRAHIHKTAGNMKWIWKMKLFYFSMLYTTTCRLMRYSKECKNVMFIIQTWSYLIKTQGKTTFVDKQINYLTDWCSEVHVYL